MYRLYDYRHFDDRNFLVWGESETSWQPKTAASELLLNIWRSVAPLTADEPGADDVGNVS